MPLNQGAWKTLSQGAWQFSPPVPVYYSISPYGTGDIKTNPFASRIPISFVNAAYTVYGTRSNLTISKPTDTADNDILIASLCFWASFTVTPPSGWNLYHEWTANGMYLKVYWKKASSEGASWTWTYTGSQESEGQVLAYRGADYLSATPFDCTATENSSASGTSLTLSQITTVTNGAMVVGIGSSNSSGAHSCADFDNERVDDNDLYAYDETKATAGATGNYTVTVPTGASMGMLLALRGCPTAITKVQSTGTYDDDASSIVLAYTGNVTAGNVLVVAVSKYTPSTDVFVVGDISKSAGTATIGSWQLDKAEEHFTSGSEYCSAALYSAVVTGTGSCTITVASVAGSYLQMGIIEFSGVSTSASRCEDTSSGEADTGTDIHAGSMDSASGAVFVAISYFNTATDTTITEDTGATLVYEDQTGAHGPSSVTEQIVAIATSLDPGWTISANRIWVAVGGVYTAGPDISITSGVATLSTAQTGNIGQGCKIVYGGHTCYISKVNSSTSFDVVTNLGAVAPDHASIAVTSISHVWASLSAAEAAFTGASYINNTDLTSANVVANLCCYYDHDDYTADTTACTIDGSTTDATRYINIYTPTGGTQSISRQRHSGIWDTSKYVLSTTTEISTLIINEVYTKITGLQVKLTTSNTNWKCGILLQDDSGGTVVSSCIANEAASITATYRLGFYSGSYTATINTFTNCLAYNFLGTGSSGFATVYDATAAGTGTRFLNCTAYNCAVGFYSMSGNYMRNVVKNCVAVGCTDCFRDDGGSEWGGGSTNNAYDQGGDPGTAGVDISAQPDSAIFVDVTSYNFNPVGGSPLLMAGIGPGSDTAISTTDIIENTRTGTLCNIGAFHKGITDVYYSLSPFGTATLLTGSPTCGISSGVMTLTVAQTGNIGVGCAITYDTSKVVYISSVTDSTHFVVVDKYGVTPPDITAGTTINSIAHNWASLSAAEAAVDDTGYLNTADLTSANVVLNLCCYYDHDDYTADTTACTIDGYTTDATRYINIYTPNGGTQSINTQRHSGVFASGKYLLDTTVTLNVADDYTRITGLQVRITRSSGTANGIAFVAGNYGRVYQCIIIGVLSGTAAGAGISQDTSSDDLLYAINNIIYDFINGAETGCRGISSSSSAAGNLYIYNNTIVNCYRGIQVSTSAATAYIKNNMVYGANDAFIGEDNNAANNISETETFGTDSSTTAQATAALFTDYAGRDLHVKDIDSDLYDAGVDLSGTFTTDIAGTTRSTWDIGAFEYVSTGTLAMILEGFRFRNDDGDEAAATWFGAQDTDITMLGNNTIRLRAIIDTSVAMNNQLFQLEYRYAPTGNNDFGNWTKVP